VVTVAQTSERQKKKDGLNALDRERAASVADEGGASAATIELQDDEGPEIEEDPSAPPTHKPGRGAQPGGTRH
jgi:general stress protein YciG